MKMGHERRDTIIGFALAVALTVIPFLMVYFQPVSRQAAIAAIAGAACIQILVHLRYFLGIRIRKSAPENIYPLVFAAVLVFIMVGGTLWIMANLNYRMGH